MKTNSCEISFSFHFISFLTFVFFSIFSSFLRFPFYILKRIDWTRNMQSITNIFNDNRKIGILLLSLGLLFLFLGVMLLFADVLLCMGNILFLSYIGDPPFSLSPFRAFPFLIGFARTLRFFNPLEKSDVWCSLLEKVPCWWNLLQKWKGVLCFFVGVVIVLFRHPIIGMIIEVYVFDPSLFFWWLGNGIAVWTLYSYGHYIFEPCISLCILSIRIDPLHRRNTRPNPLC